jgi:hypothetical protein
MYSIYLRNAAIILCSCNLQHDHKGISFGHNGGGTAAMFLLDFNAPGVVSRQFSRAGHLPQGQNYPAQKRLPQLGELS